jgi:hypothetical protein
MSDFYFWHTIGGIYEFILIPYRVNCKSGKSHK